MIVLNLSEHEREILAQVLKSYLSDLRMEIADTDSYEFREGLKARKAVLMKVLEGLGRPVGATM
jgi:hypothetical protein